MELINNTTKTLKDDLSVEIKQGSKVSIAAACFSIYAFQELKEQQRGNQLRSDLRHLQPRHRKEGAVMNRQYAEKIISALKDDLENDYKGFELADDMSRAEKLFGKELPAIIDCMEEAKYYSGTIRRNAQTIIDLLEMKLAEQATLSFDLAAFRINDTEFCKLVEQSFQLYKEAKIGMATEKVWDAFERIKTYYQQYDKKTSADRLLDVISKGDADYKTMLQEEFSALTKLGNRFRIRHHETDKKDIGCNEHYDYLFHRCLSVLKLATSVLSEVKPDEV